MKNGHYVILNARNGGFYASSNEGLGQGGDSGMG